MKIMELCEGCIFNQTCSQCDKVSKNNDENNINYCIGVDFDNVYWGCKGIEDVAETDYWFEMSYRRFDGDLLDFSYSEYSDGSWNYD